MTPQQEIEITRKLIEIDLILKGTKIRPKKVSRKKQLLTQQILKTKFSSPLTETIK